MAGSKNLWIEFPPYKDVTDFPSLISGVNMPDLFWDNVEADGADIALYDNAGTKLKRELVSIDTVNKTMELYVKKTRSATSPTFIRLNYDDAAGAETNDTDTWDASFVMVLHMNDDPDTSTIQDSTSNNNDGAKIGAGTPAESTGVYDGDKSQSYTAAGSHSITVADAASFDLVNTITVEAVSYTTNIALGKQAFASKWAVAGNNREWSFQQLAGKLIMAYGDPADGTYEGAWTSDNVVLANNTFKHMAGTFNVGTTVLYVNGASVAGAGTVPATLYNNSGNVRLGSDTGANFLDGKQSEIRISSVARSADWIAATYQSLLNNANDYKVMPVYNNSIRTNSLPNKMQALGLI